MEYQRFEAHLSRTTRTSENLYFNKFFNEKRKNNKKQKFLEMSDFNQTVHARSYDINHYF